MAKRHLDDAAEQIVQKWAKRVGNGWEPSASDIIRHLDVLAEERLREMEKGRRLRSGA